MLKYRLFKNIFLNGGIKNINLWKKNTEMYTFFNTLIYSSLDSTWNA